MCQRGHVFEFTVLRNPLYDMFEDNHPILIAFDVRSHSYNTRHNVFFFAFEAIIILALVCLVLFEVKSLASELI
jgi:hypothetical protein